MVALLRLYYRTTGRCLSYLPDRAGVCRVCRMPTTAGWRKKVGGNNLPSDAHVLVPRPPRDTDMFSGFF